MAIVKISELEQATTLQDSDVLPIVQDGETKKVTFADLIGAVSPNIEVDSELSDTSENPVQNKVVATALSEVARQLGGKQGTLTFDDEPTADSTNPVTSGGVKTALDTLEVSQIEGMATMQEEITALQETFNSLTNAEEEEF